MCTRNTSYLHFPLLTPICSVYSTRNSKIRFVPPPNLIYRPSPSHLTHPVLVVYNDLEQRGLVSKLMSVTVSVIHFWYGITPDHFGTVFPEFEIVNKTFRRSTKKSSYLLSNMTTHDLSGTFTGKEKVSRHTRTP